jgi:hypothetical protein
MLPPAISVNISSPLWRTGGHSENITNLVGSYRHNILADGGFWSASFDLGGGIDVLEDWIAGGLGRHIVVSDQSLDIAWEGFVNEIQASMGRLELTVGPLLDVSNAVSLVYSTVDTSGGGRPRVGVRATTDLVENTNSQDRWGVRRKVLSSGGVQPDEAEQIRDLFLSENSDPPRSQRFTNTGAGGEAKLTVHCLGYYHWLDYVYDQKVLEGERDASAKLLDILTGTDAETGNPYNLNSDWLVWNIDNVDATNTTQVKAWEQKHKLAKDLIDGVVVMGDASLNRWLFGVYEDRSAYYHAAPTTVEYLQYLTSNLDTVFTPNSVEVYPWNMRPGRWMVFPDFMSTRRHPDNLREDPRAMFIEAIDYTAPYTATAQAGPTARLDQMLGQLGLSGVGA